ncbi:MAG TPA: hypothetical protein VGD10_00160 [Allosphingosinicella sp.]|uniref:hypothetical protein n=1 Tax=Allosphingosinicella sp. TaxID=2823234 RepID=UPI002EDA3EFE
MNDDKQQLVDEETMETASVAPPNPEERAFNGHPDHPPAVPDQPVEGNQELIRQSDESTPEQGLEEAERQPS